MHKELEASDPACFNLDNYEPLKEDQGTFDRDRKLLTQLWFNVDSSSSPIGPWVGMCGTYYTTNNASELYRKARHLVSGTIRAIPDSWCHSLNKIDISIMKTYEDPDAREEKTMFWPLLSDLTVALCWPRETVPLKTNKDSAIRVERIDAAPIDDIFKHDTQQQRREQKRQQILRNYTVPKHQNHSYNKSPFNRTRR
jgi:hypothetical protein